MLVADGTSATLVFACFVLNVFLLVMIASRLIVAKVWKQPDPNANGISRCWESRRGGGRWFLVRVRESGGSWVVRSGGACIKSRK